MTKEWNSSYLKDLDKLKETMIKNCDSVEDYLPRYILKPEFWEKHQTHLDKSMKDASSNPYLKFSSYQEYRLLSLINNLKKAKNKFQHNRHIQSEDEVDIRMNIQMDLDKNENYETLPGKRPTSQSTSQLIQVNDIVKNSFELTTLVYLLEWLHSISPKERAGGNERPYFEKTKEMHSKSSEKNYFHPDVLNRSNSEIHTEDMEKMNKIMEIVVSHIRQGRIEEAQKTAEYYNQSFLSAMLTGGLPMNDFLLDKAEAFAKVDFDLFPPFMKTKDLAEVKSSIEKLKSVRSQYQDNFPNSGAYQIFGKVVGNPNWLLWFYSVYDSCETQQNISLSDKYANQMKLLQSYISGNPSFLEKVNTSLYDLLYSQMLNFLNFKVIQEYSTQANILDYHFIENEAPDFSSAYNKLVKGKNINDIINLIKSKDKYKEAAKQDFLIEIELELIQLHFIEFRGDSRIYYEKFNSLLIKILTVFTSSEFEAYLRSHYLLVENSIQPRDQERSLQTELEKKLENNINLMRLNYFKILFLGLVSYFNLQDQLQIEKGLTNLIKETFYNYDVILSFFYNEQMRFIPKIENLVYLQCFSLDIDTVQNNLTSLANFVSEKEPEKYKILVREIHIHFRELQADLNTNIANNSKIYHMPTNLTSIDDILERDLKENFVMSKDDENKIIQVKLLFTDGRLDNSTILKYMLKLSIKFLSKNKFTEALQLQSQFQEQLSMEYILGGNFVKTHELDRGEGELKFFFLLEQNSSESDRSHLTEILKGSGLDISHLAIYFTVLFTKIVLDCYMNYLNLVKNIFSDLKNTSNINTHFSNILSNKCKEVIKTFKIFIRLVRVLIINEEIKEVLMNFFSEDDFKEIRTIISKWIFQCLKWSVDIYTQDCFKGLNLVTEDR